MGVKKGSHRKVGHYLPKKGRGAPLQTGGERNRLEILKSGW